MKRLYIRFFIEYCCIVPSSSFDKSFLRKQLLKTKLLKGVKSWSSHLLQMSAAHDAACTICESFNLKLDHINKEDPSCRSITGFPQDYIFVIICAQNSQTLKSFKIYSTDLFRATLNGFLRCSLKKFGKIFYRNL